MPYFKWRGVTAQGAIRKGVLFSHNQRELDRCLFERNIALISATETNPLLLPMIRLSHKIDFFNQLSTLLKAGVLLPNACAMLAQQTTHMRLSATISRYEHQLRQGMCLRTIIESDPLWQDVVVAALVGVGEQTGALAEATEAIVHYLVQKQEFRTRLYQALRLPLMTTFFFCIVTMVILLWVIPLFGAFLSTLQQPLPSVTVWAIALSMHVRTFFFWSLCICFAGAIYITLRLVKRSEYMREKVDMFVLKIPFIGTLIEMYTYTYFFQTLTMLVRHGISLVHAFSYALDSVSNKMLYNRFLLILDAVRSGASLSVAFASAESICVDIIPFIAMGQESGTISYALGVIAAMCHRKTVARLSLITLWIQPLLMAFLGALIAMLITAVYLPVLHMSYS